MKYDTDKLNKLYRTLPEELKDILFSFDIAQQMQTIGEKYRLHHFTIRQLADEVAFVVLGVTPYGNFAEQLAKRLSMSKEEVAPIVIDIQENIFGNVQETLEKLNPGEVTKGEEGQSKDDSNKKRPYSGTDPYHEPIEP